jgi:hypothetical protein
VNLLISHICSVSRNTFPNLPGECLVGIGSVLEFGADPFFRNPMVVLGLLVEVLSSTQEFVVGRYDGSDTLIGLVEPVAVSFV